MTVTACSDLENEVDEMQQQLQESDLVELTIHPHVPGMKAGTRSIENDALTSIKVLAFDESKKLIKVVDATNVTSGTTGSFSVRVPSKTRIIHFIGNLPNGVTLPDVGDSEDELKTITTSGDMSYWGYASFNSVTELKAFKGQKLTLYRNKAKISIKAADGVTASIAGVANAYQYGVLVPHNNDGFNFDLDTYDYQTLPSNTTKMSEQTGEAFTYVFEHPNDSKSNALNVICLVDGKYYKVVLAKKVDDAMVYYDIIRNHQYNIKINQVDTNLGKADFNAAADEKNEPINDVEVVEDKQVALQVTTSSSSTRSYDNTTYTVTVTTTENKLTDISTLSFSWLNADIYQLTGTTGVTDNGNSTYTVTANQAVFTFTLKDGYIGKEVSNSITFAGDGTHVVVTPATANLNLSTFVDMYEMYFDGGNLGGSTEYDKFFYDKNNVNLQTKTLTTQYVDAGANNSTLAHNHVNAAINMQSNSMIKFTIAEERYLTLLVARSVNVPSIDLQKDGKAWTATSDEGQVPATYNFSKDGDITTSGRLIRYTLPAGTYTLKGSDTSYLLYYLRVSTERPTMTDIVQPTAADYSLSWSGGEWGNDIKIGDTYFVDDDAMAFTPTLSYTGLTLSTISNLTIVTTTYRFEDVDDDTGTRITETVETREYKDQSIPVTLDTNLNAGTYSLSGKATVNSEYKYAAFYDYAQLNAVEFSAKNTIKVNLYNSWDGNAAPVTEFVAGGQNNILGFKMPMKTLPMGSNKEINFTINNWQRYESGLGVNYDNEPNYKLTSQTQRDQNDENKSYNRIHPRPEWIYKMSWLPESVAGNQSITVTTSDADVYFSNGDKIAQSVTIATPVTGTVENPLSIALDFYADSENLGDGATYDLKAGSTPFYLKATISSDDAEKYSGQTVLLNGTFSSSKGYGKDKNGIHWDYSEIDTPKDGYGKIACNSDGTQLQFEIDRSETDYLIEWVFVPGGQYTGDDINFTYQISGATVDSKACTLNNESQTTLNVDVLDISLDFDYPATFDGSPAPLDNMVFGVSNFYLRATISQADAIAFAGRQVLLAGAFSATSGGGNDAVSWYDSRVNEGTINYDDSYNGTGLLFTIDANQQNYFIHWCFERYNYGEDPASFTYTISKPEDANYRFFRVSGETETSLTLKNSAEIFSGTYQFNTGNDWGKSYSISETFPVGTKITVGFGAGQKDGGCTVKFCDAASQNALKIPSFTGVNYGPNENLYFSFTGSKTFEVWVNEMTELYVNGDGSGNGNSGTANGNLSNKPLEGFKIEGTDAILQSITVTAPESALRNAQDNNNE